MSAERWRITVLRGFAEATHDDKLREIALKAIEQLEAEMRRPMSAKPEPRETPSVGERVI